MFSNIFKRSATTVVLLLRLSCTAQAVGSGTSCSIVNDNTVMKIESVELITHQLYLPKELACLKDDIFKDFDVWIWMVKADSKLAQEARSARQARHRSWEEEPSEQTASMHSFHRLLPRQPVSAINIGISQSGAVLQLQGLAHLCMSWSGWLTR